MNKQEAIDEIKKQSTQAYGDFAIMREMRDTAIHIVNQIDEPQKVTIPKFVAEWIVEMKQDERPLYSVMSSLMNKMNHEWDVWKSANMNFSEIVAQAWIYGYEIEKEKLYTVEIPDPNSYYNCRFLSRNDNGVCIDASNHNNWKQRRENHLTESEIKKDFEWAWQWAEPVEVE